MAGNGSLSIDVDFGEIKVLLEGMAQRASNPEYPLEKIAKRFSEQIQRKFLTEGFGEWPDIAPRSRRGRKYNRYSGPLIDGGFLMEAASATTEGVKDSLFNIDGNELTMGVSRPDVFAHLYGSPKLREDGSMGGEPARYFMPEDSEIEEIENYGIGVVEDYIVGVG